MRAASAAWCRRGRHTYYAIHQRHQDSSSNPRDCLVYSGNNHQGCAAIKMKPHRPVSGSPGAGFLLFNVEFRMFDVEFGLTSVGNVLE